MTHYQVLGVGNDATADEIRVAFHREARRWHPDFHLATGAGLNDASRKMQAVNEAWRVLRDPVERRRYDAQLPRGWGDDDPVDLDADYRAADYRAAEREQWVPASAPGPSRPRGLLMAPVLLAGAAAGAGALSLVLGRAMLALAVVCGVAAGVLFVVVPIMVMVRARQE